MALIPPCHQTTVILTFILPYFYIKTHSPHFIVKAILTTFENTWQEENFPKVHEQISVTNYAIINSRPVSRCSFDYFLCIISDV